MKEKLTPHWKYLKKFKDMDQEHKQEQKANFDRRYQAKVLPDIPDEVWITMDDTPSHGRVVSHGGAPRLYVVETHHGHVQWNQSQLNVVLGSAHLPNLIPAPAAQQLSRDPITTRSHTGNQLAPSRKTQNYCIVPGKRPWELAAQAPQIEGRWLVTQRRCLNIPAQGPTLDAKLTARGYQINLHRHFICASSRPA